MNFARAFACYLSDKLEEKGDRNDYLNGTCDTFVSMDKNGKWIFAYPKGKERLRINKAFDELINELKEIGILSPRKEKKKMFLQHILPLLMDSFVLRNKEREIRYECKRNV